jgi:UDP-glucose 4-epimerase
MKVLVTGAAGYVGSVVTDRLLAHGHAVAALDNLSRGHRDAVHPGAAFLHGDLLDRQWLVEEVRRGRFDAVVHLAAEALVEESVRDPGRCFRVNVGGGINLLDAMVAAAVPAIVFSSTAAVYGEPAEVPIPEDADMRPVNPYGESKLAFERALEWYGRAHGLRYVSLRYFNACGAAGEHGERHSPETHFIPILLEVARGDRAAIHLYGTDYDTPDGTCVRDYVHVSDIADAHALCLDRMASLEHAAFNLGNGAGHSNREVIDAVRKVTGHPIPVVAAPRRAGDPARLVASPARAIRELGWRARVPDLESMIDSAWRFARAGGVGPKGHTSTSLGAASTVER